MNAGPSQREPGALHRGRGTLHIGIIGNPGPAQQRRATREILLRGNQSLLSLIHGFLGMRNLLRGDRTRLAQALTPVEVRPRPVEVRASLGEDSAQLVAAGEHRVDLPDRLGELILRLLQGDARVRVVEPHELLPHLNVVGLVRVNGHDRATDLRADIDHVTGHVRIVGVLVIPGVQPPVGRRADCDDHESRHRDE